MKSVKIISWNVNGLAACIRKGFLKFTLGTNADVICIQEIRSQCEMQTDGYFQFWNPAKRLGYAGTMVLSKQLPISCDYGTGKEDLDGEGRMISLEFENYYVVNVYFPNTWGEPERRDYRREWESALREYLDRFQKPAVVCGDFNIGHKFIDIYPENQRNQKRDDDPYTYTAEHRQDFDKLLELGFVDAFRVIHPEKQDAYTWWAPKNNNRAENRGSRLDYFLVSEEMRDYVREVWHYTDEPGSDHCPISMLLDPIDKTEGTPADIRSAAWQGIDWDKMEQILEAQQKQIAEAAFRREWRRVGKLQEKLIESFAAKALAVRFVADKKSQAGVDGVKLLTDADKMLALNHLSPLFYRPLPYRYQEATERGKKLELLIPAARDKAMLKLQAYALDPIAESILDKRSFSGRHGRSALDAHAYLALDFSGPDAAKWAVKVDVKAYYKSILHEKILEVAPMDKSVLKRTLRVGMIKERDLFPTEQGISYASPLSPILGNLLLNGVQSYIYDELYPTGHRDYKGGSATRYADDIIIAARNKEQAEAILVIVHDFLAIRGLQLNLEKSGIYNMRDGFDFIGRHYQQIDGTLIVRPSQASIKKCEQDLKELILGHKGTQRKLIEKINKKLTGWAAYHRIAEAYMEFRHIDSIVEGLLVERMCSRYPRWHRETVLEKFWIKVGQDHIFALPDDPTLRVIQLAKIVTVEHKPASLNFNPYLDKAYYEWIQGRRAIQKASGKYKAVWERQEGICAFCGHHMLRDEEVKVIEIDIGKGHRANNLAYIHKECDYNVFDGEARVMRNEPIDLTELIGSVMDDAPAIDSPYQELTEFFRVCERTPFTLTFQEIEKIIGDRLDEEAYSYEAFWYEDMPERSSPLWELEEHHTQSRQLASSDYCIADSWLSQGYQIKALHLSEQRVVFRKVAHNVNGLVIPKQLREQKLPDDAVYEINQFFKYIIKKYGIK